MLNDQVSVVWDTFCFIFLLFFISVNHFQSIYNYFCIKLYELYLKDVKYIVSAEASNNIYFGKRQTLKIIFSKSANRCESIFIYVSYYHLIFMFCSFWLGRMWTKKVFHMFVKHLNNNFVQNLDFSNKVCKKILNLCKSICVGITTFLNT